MSETKTKRVNSYNIALKEWNAERKKKGLKWLSPKKDTTEYIQVQKIKQRIELEKKKPVDNVVRFRTGKEDKKEVSKPIKKNTKKADDYNATIKKLMSINKTLTEKIIKETDAKKVLDIVDKLKISQKIKGVLHVILI
jgi:hypothetical protein